MSLYISMTVPDRELEKSPIDLAITRLAERVAIERLEQRLPDGPALDLTFMLSTEEDKPPFEGMMMGGYTADNQTLFFRAAVPSHLSQSDKAAKYVSLVLQDVVDNADEYFLENGLVFNKNLWQQTVHSIAGTSV